MANSCNIIVHARDRQTKKYTKKASELHRDFQKLGQLTKKFGITKANQLIYLTQSPEFMAKYDADMYFPQDQVESDAVEPWLASVYKQLADTMMSDVTFQDINDYLQQKYGKTDLNFQRAIEAVNSFNKQHTGDNLYIATVRQNQGGSYDVEIVPNTVENQRELLDVLQKKINSDILIQVLKAAGATPNISEEAIQNIFNSDAEFINGVRGVVTLMENADRTDYAIQTGLLIVTQLAKDNQHLQRAIKALNKLNADSQADLLALLKNDKEVLDKFIAMHIEGHEFDENNVLEILGLLVGKILKDEMLETQNSKIQNIKRLLQRMLEWLKQHLYLTHTQVERAAYKARIQAEAIVKDFLQDNFKLGANQSDINTRNSSLRREAEKLNDFIRDALKHIQEIQGYNTDKQNEELTEFKNRLINSYTKVYQGIQTADLEKPTVFTDANQKVSDTVQSGLVTAAIDVIEQLRQVAEELQSVYSENVDYIKEGEIIAKCASVVEMAESLYNTMTSLGYGESALNSFKVLAQDLGRILNGGVKSSDNADISFKSALYDARVHLGSRLLSDVNGCDYLYLTDYISVSGKGKVTRHGKQIKSMTEILTTSDIHPTSSFLTRWVTTIANSPDLLNQMFYAKIEQEKHKANLETLEYEQQLFELYDRLRELGFSKTDMFMERFKDGSLTGNIISEQNWGQWERDYQDARKRFRQEYFDEYQRAAAVNAYYEDEYIDNITGFVTYDAFDANGKENQRHYIKQWKNKSEMLSDPNYIAAETQFISDWHAKHSMRISDPNQDIEKIGTEEEEFIIVPAMGETITDEKTGEVFVKEDYTNKEYFALRNMTKKVKGEEKNIGQSLIDWLDDYLELKRKLDNKLPKYSTNKRGLRAPQYNASAGNVIKNAAQVETGEDLSALSKLGEWFKNKGSGIKALWRTKVVQKIIENPNDVEFGADSNTYTLDDAEVEQEGVYNAALFNDLNMIDQVPITGVKKLKNMNDLSTDLIFSTIHYAAMACSYDALNRISPAVKQTFESLSKRKYKSETNKTEEQLGFSSHYNRLKDYLDLELFNNNFDAKVNRRYWRRKLVRKLGSLATYTTLGWNSLAALRNATTGLWEMTHEAVGGEVFGRMSFTKALGVYEAWVFQSCGIRCKNMFDRKGHVLETNLKVAAFKKYFNISEANREKFADRRMNQLRGKKSSILEISMLPYSLTDDWMQTVPYLAAAMETKVRRVDEHGEVLEECSLWDAYTVEEEEVGDEVKTKQRTKLTLRPGNWVIEDNNLSSLIQYFNEAPFDVKESTDAIKAIAKTDEEGNTLYDEDDRVIIKDNWVPLDNRMETKFNIMCRRVNHRMHGIYNRGDRGAYATKTYAAFFLSLKKYALGLWESRYTGARMDFSGDVRQGAFRTLASVAYTSFVPYDSDNFEFSVGNLLYGIGNFMKICLGEILDYLTFGVVNDSLKQKTALRKYGYSPNQIRNLAKFINYMAVAGLLRFLYSVVMPALFGGGKDDPDDEKNVWGITAFISNIFYTIHKLELQFIKHVPIIGGDLTIDDASLLDDDLIRNRQYETSGTIPFNPKDLFMHLIAGSYIEQVSWNPVENLIMSCLVYEDGKTWYKSATELFGLINGGMIGVNAIQNIIETIVYSKPGATFKSGEQKDWYKFKYTMWRTLTPFKRTAQFKDARVALDSFVHSKLTSGEKRSGDVPFGALKRGSNDVPDWVKKIPQEVRDTISEEDFEKMKEYYKKKEERKKEKSEKKKEKSKKKSIKQELKEAKRRAKKMKE